MKVFLAALLVITSLFASSRIYVKASDLPEELREIPDAFELGMVKDFRFLMIPGYKYAFNPSIAQNGEGYLMAFRNEGNHLVRTGKMKVYHSFLNTVALDSDFSPIPGSVQEVDTGNLFSEDPRLVTHKGTHYIFYNENPYIRTDYRNMAVSALSQALQPLGKLQYQNLSHTIEKNWAPFFDENDRLNFLYDMSPLTVHTYAQIGHPFFFQKRVATHPYLKIWAKKWGEPHGGTPAVKISKNEYLTIFHSSKVLDNKIRWFFMGALTFSTSPNLEIKQISLFPIFSTKFYCSTVSPTAPAKSKRVIYPAGLTISGDTAHVSCGVNDSKSALLSLDLKTIFEHTADDTLVEPKE